MQKIFFPFFLLCTLVGTFLTGVYPNKLKNREFANAEISRLDSEKTAPISNSGLVFSKSKMGISVKAKTDSSTCLGIDPRVAHVMAQLEFLPAWCPPLLLFAKGGGVGIDGCRLEKDVDGCGRVVGVTVVKVSDGSVGGRVDATWEPGCSMDRLVRVDGPGISHLFEYDEHDCAVRHVLIGNLTGKRDFQEEYETRFQFDESFRPVEIKEGNGRVRLLKYPDTADPFFVAVEHDQSGAARQAITSDEMGCEQIEDDGGSIDINDLSDVSWRRWKRASLEDEGGQIRQIVTVGAYDPMIGQQVVLRRESSLLASSGDVVQTELFDADGALVSWTRGRQDCYHLEIATEDDILEFVKWVRSAFPSLAESSAMSEKSGEVPVFVSSTSRGEKTRVVYKDGTEERCEYALDGTVYQIIYRDGRKAVVKRDSRGRIVSASDWNVGASSPDVVTYEYAGPFLSGWSMSDGHSCRLGRDCFGRVTAIELVGNQGTDRYSITYDLLDRITAVVVSGRKEWKCQRQFSMDGAEVTTEYIQDGLTRVVHELRRENGSVKTRVEEVSLGEAFLYSYNEDGRLMRVDHQDKTQSHLVVERQYEQIDGKQLFKETSRFSDGTQQIEEKEPSGKVLRRLWLNADGTVALEERTIVMDAQGSKCIQRTAGNEVRSVEWKVGDNGHVVSCGGFSFEHDASGRCTVKRSQMGRKVFYVWNAKGQMTRQYSTDGTVDYRFSYDDKGRICGAYDAIAQKAVERTFDAAGRLVGDGEESSRVYGMYDPSGGLIRLELPKTVTLRYDGGMVYREGEGGSWSIETGQKKGRTQQRAVVDCAASEIEFSDPLGSWTEQFSYDVLFQLQKESGEFQLKGEFDAFGIAKAVRASGIDDDGNVVESDGVTFEYDALGRLSKVRGSGDEESYRYDGFGRIQEISRKGGGSTRLCWLGSCEIGALQKGSLTQLKVPHPTTFQPVAIEVNNIPYRVECDARGSLTALFDVSSGRVCEVYRYSAFGALHIYGSSLDDVRQVAISPWLYCGKRLLMASYDFGARRYCVRLMRWLERDPLGIVDTADDRLYVRNNPVAYVDPSGLFPWSIDWEAIGNSIVHAVRSIASSAFKTITFAKGRLDWILEVRSAYEDLVFQLFGGAWLRCSGYNLDATSSFVYGEGKEPRNVRITLINGILNGAPEAKKSAALLSSTHGDVPVHCVYAATQGFSGDMLRGAFAKAGIVSYQAQLLADLWHELIDEMKGVSGGGTILHYAHSLGATDTLNALQLLTADERALIQISTFGSPTLLDDGVCGKVDNYVSVKDGVPILDFHRYADGAKGIRSNVHFVPSDGAIPLVDHYFDGKTYTGVLEMLGHKFQEEFLLQH